MKFVKYISLFGGMVCFMCLSFLLFILGVNISDGKSEPELVASVLLLSVGASLILFYKNSIKYNLMLLEVAVLCFLAGFFDKYIPLLFGVKLILFFIVLLGSVFTTRFFFAPKEGRMQ